MLFERDILTVGEKIRKIRKEIGARQEDLVSGKDLTREMISRIETGKNKLTLDTAELIASNINKIIIDKELGIDLITSQFLLEEPKDQAERIINLDIDVIEELKMLNDGDSELNARRAEITVLMNQYEISGITQYKYYNTLNDYYDYQSNYIECYNCLLNCLEVASKLLDHHCVTSTYRNFIHLYNTLGRYKESINVGMYALNYGRINGINDNGLMMAIIFNVAKAYRKIEDANNCLKWIDMLENQYTIPEKRKCDIKILKANCFYLNGEYSKSIKIHEEILKEALKTRDAETTAISYANIGENYMRLDHLDMAEDALHHALSINPQPKAEHLYIIYEYANELAIKRNRGFLVIKGYYERALKLRDSINCYKDILELIIRMIKYCDSTSNYDYMMSIVEFIRTKIDEGKFEENNILEFYYVTSFYMKSHNIAMSNELQEEGLKYIRKLHD